MIILGPIDINEPLEILFHFGGADGHQCDRAEFRWYINSIFEANLNFDNAATGEEIEQGPFTIFPRRYIKSGCDVLIFSFECAETEGGCHEGAAFDVTYPDGSFHTFYIMTSTPTAFTMCELYGAGFSDPP